MGMQARIELAIIDHNNNIDRKQCTTSKGTKNIYISLCMLTVWLFRTIEAQAGVL